ncbi:MAG: peptide-methionine (S)-S-oxide reductase MsrA [Candidatus Thermoplasmatota archaeon]|nr:peptide-methionine (S)-S-oxide reductase MsrA [Candidatus Thermoplasmatota archaeon]MCL5790879.1 peptide-methionine (S)-S-oxide reductase MsrA [Candidatus Thermoplasmatota archaeon]
MESEIILGGGCFWCTEAVFSRVEGVLEVTPGYSGGSVDNPSYRAVCTGTTGHAEVVRLRFDENKISLNQILQIFFEIHDPTTPDRQGADVGTQYRSTVISFNDAQFTEVNQFIRRLQGSGKFKEPIVTSIQMFKNFYPAEDYHIRYYERQSNEPYCRIVISPKIKKLMKNFKPIVREP